MKNRMSCLFMATLLVLAACGKEQTDEQAIASTETVTTKSETARLETPAEVAAGAGFAVSWTGPDDEGDYVTIVEAGAQQGAYLSYAYTNSGTPLSLRALDSPGSYEIRYVDGASKDILVSASITVTKVEASLDAPSEVGAGAGFAVSWTGPGNDGDYVTIVEAGTAQGSYLGFFAHPPEMVYSKGKSPNTGVLRRFLSRIVEQMSTALALRASRAPLPRSRPFFGTYFSQNHRVCPLQGRFLI